MSANELDGLMLVPLIAPDGVLACVLVEFRDAPGLSLRLTARAAAELAEGLGKLTATRDWSTYRPTPVPAPEAPPKAVAKTPGKWLIIQDMDPMLPSTQAPMFWRQSRPGWVADKHDARVFDSREEATAYRDDRQLAGEAVRFPESWVIKLDGLFYAGHGSTGPKWVNHRTSAMVFLTEEAATSFAITQFRGLNGIDPAQLQVHALADS